LRFGFAFALLLANDRAQACAATVNHGAHTFAGQLRARQHGTRAPTQQFAFARTQHLSPQLSSDAVDDLDAQVSAAVGQFLPGNLVGREQSRLSSDQTGQCGTGALADAQDGQFGVAAGPLRAPTSSRADSWTAIQSAEVDDEAAEEAER
jgi:hypothetical protein